MSRAIRHFARVLHWTYDGRKIPVIFVRFGSLADTTAWIGMSASPLRADTLSICISVCKVQKEDLALWGRLVPKPSGR